MVEAPRIPALCVLVAGVNAFVYCHDC